MNAMGQLSGRVERLRHSITPKSRDRIRAATLAMGRATAPARMLPSFLVIGAQRSGTTSLYKLLTGHPQVVRPAFQKGIGYFDLNYSRGMRWYRGHFPVAVGAWARTRRTGPPLTFESSGYYAFHPLAAERIAQDLPDVKLILMVRDPVERAFSAHAHETARGFEDEPFAEAIALEAERLAGEEDRLIADPAYQSFHHRHHAYVSRGRYIEQIERFERSGLGGSLLVVDADAFFADPVAQFHRIQDWLGLVRWTPETVGKLNPRHRDPMDPSLRATLSREFEALDARLVRYLGSVPTWRAS